MFTFTPFHLAVVVCGITMVWFLITFLHIKQLQNKLDETKVSKDPEISWFMNTSAILSLIFMLLVFVSAFVCMMVFDPSGKKPAEPMNKCFMEFNEQVRTIPVD